MITIVKSPPSFVCMKCGKKRGLAILDVRLLNKPDYFQYIAEDNPLYIDRYPYEYRIQVYCPHCGSKFERAYSGYEFHTEFIITEEKPTMSLESFITEQITPSCKHFCNKSCELFYVEYGSLVQCQFNGNATNCEVLKKVYSLVKTH